MVSRMPMRSHARRAAGRHGSQTSKLSSATHRRCCGCLSVEATRKAAAAYGGIDESTLWRWAQQSATFANDLTRAEAESEVALVAIVRQAARDDWRAAAHLLERRWPDTWGKREKVDIDL